MSNHFSAGVCSIIEDGVKKFLVVDYYHSLADLKAGWNKQVKFPGGTNKEFARAKPLDTLHREFLGETGLMPPSLPLQIHVGSKKADDGNGVHTQHFFLFSLEECQGALRTEILNDNGNWLSVPYWADGYSLRKRIIRSHSEALEKADR
ncbi:MAG: NUDIX hydrolase [Patescibacteria group bacterium]